MVWRKLNSLLSRRRPRYGNTVTFRCNPSFRRLGGCPCVTPHLRLGTKLGMSVWWGSCSCSRVALPPVLSAGPCFAGGLSEPCLPPGRLLLNVACQQAFRLLNLQVSIFSTSVFSFISPLSSFSPFISLSFEKLWLNIHSIRASLVAQRLKRLPQCGRPGFDPWVRKIPWRRKWQPTPVLLPGESHGCRSLVGYSPRGRKESDTTERLHIPSVRVTILTIVKYTFQRH